MPQTRKRLVLAAAAALALAFTGCTSASEPVAVETSAPATPAPAETETATPTPVAPTPTETPTEAETPADDSCNGLAPYGGRTAYDRGVMDMAQGTVQTDSSGAVVSYTVARGDTFIGITDRLCFDGQTLAEQNGFAFDGSLREGAVLLIEP